MKHKGYKRPLLFGVALGLAVVLALGLGGIASAANQPPPGAARALEMPAIGPGFNTFELDGNATTETALCANLPDDWDRLNPAPTACSHAKDSEFKVDPAGGSIFTGGGSKDEHLISDWRWTDGSVPDKDNLTNVYAAAYKVDGNLMIYFGADRFANNGDSNIGFWFFQDPNVGAKTDGTGTFSGTHTHGDLLVVSAFTQGGRISTVDVYEWVGDINISAFLPGTCFTGFLAETRSSQTLNAQLKDFVTGTLNTCCDITVTASLTPSCDQGFGYSAQAYKLDGVTPIDATYAWSCTGAANLSWTGKSGTRTAAQDVVPGSYTCTVTASQASYPSCLATSAEKTVTVYAPLTATANLTPHCTLAEGFDYAGTTGGGPAWNTPGFLKTAAWAFTPAADVVDPDSDESTSAVPSGNRVVTNAASTYTGTLTVSYPNPGATGAVDGKCTISAVDSVKIKPISVTVNLQPSCDLTTDATVGITGGDGSIETCSLAVKNPSNNHLAGSPFASCVTVNNIPYAVAGNHTATFSVTDHQVFEDEVLDCPANNQDIEELAVPLGVDLSLTTAVPACTIPGTPGANPGTINGVSYTAVPSGGGSSPSYRFKWDNGTASVAVFRGVTCPTDWATDNTCGVDFNDNDFCALATLRVNLDAQGAGATASEALCAAVTSETETVTRQTTMTASNLP